MSANRWSYIQMKIIETTLKFDAKNIPVFFHFLCDDARNHLLQRAPQYYDSDSRKYKDPGNETRTHHLSATVNSRWTASVALTHWHTMLTLTGVSRWSFFALVQQSHTTNRCRAIVRGSLRASCQIWDIAVPDIFIPRIVANYTRLKYKRKNRKATN